MCFNNSTPLYPDSHQNFNTCPKELQSICGETTTNREFPISVTFVYVSKVDRKAEDGPFLFGCGSKSEQTNDFRERTVETITNWAKKFEKNGAIVNYFVDGARIEPSVLQTSSDFMCEELSKKGVDTSRILMRDLRVLPDIALFASREAKPWPHGLIMRWLFRPHQANQFWE